MPDHMHHMAGGGWFMPFASSLFVMLALTALATWLLARRGMLPLVLQRRRPAITGVRHDPAEAAARQILAERFARGEIGSEEFMERSSMLNWTPGLERRP